MSWNKNTLNHSGLDGIVKVLENCDINYTLTYLGNVRGYGLNDSDNSTYVIRKLEYKDQVIIEQMQRTKDCDMDDYLVSIQFPKDNCPSYMPLEIYVDESEEE